MYTDSYTVYTTKEQEEYDKINTFDHELVKELAIAYKEWEHDSAMHIVAHVLAKITKDQESYNDAINYFTEICNS